MNDKQMRENIKITAEEARWMLADGITVTQHAQEVLWAEGRIDDLEDELAAIKKKARAAVNAPYEDILDMGLAQALMELKEEL